MVYQYAHDAILLLAESFYYWWNKDAHLELLEIFEEMEQDFFKKHKKYEFGQPITYVLGCNMIRWTKIAC